MPPRVMLLAQPAMRGPPSSAEAVFETASPDLRPTHLRRTLSAASCCRPLQPPAGPVSVSSVPSASTEHRVVAVVVVVIVIVLLLLLCCCRREDVGSSPKRDADSAGTSSDFRRPQTRRTASSISKSPLAAHPRRSWTLGQSHGACRPSNARCRRAIQRLGDVWRTSQAHRSTARSAHGFYFLPRFAPAGTWYWL